MNYNSVFFVRKLNEPDNPKICKFIDVFMTFAKIGVVSLEEVKDEKEIDSSTLVVSIGGDGTALYAMKLSAQYQTDCICFNMGNVGFLADFHPSEVSDVYDLLNHGGLRIERRALLNATGEGEEAVVAANDIVVSRLYADEMLDYELYVNDSFAGSHRANGVIISSPTGSTAYALSAGGAILHPDLGCMQITPVAPFTMTSRPIIVSSRHTIEIRIDPNKLRGTKQVVVRADGQVTTLGDQEGICVVRIESHTHKASVLHRHEWNFFDTLTEKLNWNK